MECEEWGKRVVNLIRNRSGTFMVRNFEKTILKGDSEMYFATFQTTSCLWCTFPLIEGLIISYAKSDKMLEVQQYCFKSSESFLKTKFS